MGAVVGDRKKGDLRCAFFSSNVFSDFWTKAMRVRRLFETGRERSQYRVTPLVFYADGEADG